MPSSARVRRKNWSWISFFAVAMATFTSVAVTFCCKLSFISLTSASSIATGCRQITKLPQSFPKASPKPPQRLPRVPQTTPRLPLATPGYPQTTPGLQKCCKVCKNGISRLQKSCKVCKNAKSIARGLEPYRFRCQKVTNGGHFFFDIATGIEPYGFRFSKNASRLHQSSF